MQDKIIKAKTAWIQAHLERWAKREKILKPGQYISFRMEIRQSATVVEDSKKKLEGYMDMKPEDFFTMEKLIELGVPRNIYAVKVHNGIRNATGRSDWMSDEKRSATRYQTVREFLTAFGSVSKFQEVRNVGETSAQHFIAALRNAGLPVYE